MQIKRRHSGKRIVPRSGVPVMAGVVIDVPNQRVDESESMANAQAAPPAHGDARLRGQALGVFLIGLATLAPATTSGQDIERDPINYSTATPRNVVSQLQERLT